MSAPATHRRAGALAGTGALIRLILRRDRVVLAIWILITLSFPLLNAAAMGRLFGSAEQRQAFVGESVGNPLVSAFHGPIHSATVEGLVAWRTRLQGLFATGLGSLLLVIRHTRTDEQAGRRELLRAGVVSRHAELTAVLGAVFAANLLIAALLSSLLIFAVGYPAAGSIAFSLSLAASGCVFAAVAAVAAQVAGSAAGARALAIGTLGVLWVLRMLGDAGGGVDGALPWAVWLSPLGWAGSVRPYAGEQWWVLLLFLSATLALAAVAYGMSARRDLGAGLIPSRLGRAEAPASLRSPLGLALRLHSGPLLAAGVALALVSSAIAWVSVSLEGMLSSSPAVEAWLAPLRGATTGEAFLTLSIYILVAMFVAAYAVAAALRARSEESSARAEVLLSTPTSRTRWLGSHLAFAVVGPLLLAVIVGACAGLTSGLVTGHPGKLPGYVAMALRHLPAAWVMGGIATLLFGRFPRIALPATWGSLAFFVFLVGFWEAGVIEQPLFNPLAHTHPILEPSLLPLVALVLVAAALMVLGTLSFRRRDVVD